MNKIALSKARASLAEIANRVGYGKERYLLERNGKAVAAVIPIEDLEALQALEEAIDLTDARKALKEKRSIPYDVVRKKLGLGR